MLNSQTPTKFTLGVISLGLVLSITACTDTNQQPAEAEPAQIAPAQTQAQTQPVVVQKTAEPVAAKQGVQLEIFKLDYQLPADVRAKCKVEPNETELGCPTIDIMLARSKPAYIADEINAQITGDKAVADDAVFSALKAELDDFARSAFEDGGMMSMTYTRTVDIERLPDYAKLVQVRIDSDDNAGGAHGMQSSEYLLFDTALAKRVKLDDILTPNAPINAVVKGKYEDYVRQMPAEDLQAMGGYEGYIASWPFEMTDNVYFSDAGLSFVFQPYQLGPYVMGHITLSISYAELKDLGLLKAQYAPR